MIWSSSGSRVDSVKRFSSAILRRRSLRNPINRSYFSEPRPRLRQAVSAIDRTLRSL
jgi:hypothetical protein